MSHVAKAANTTALYGEIIENIENQSIFCPANGLPPQQLYYKRGPHINHGANSNVDYRYLTVGLSNCAEYSAWCTSHPQTSTTFNAVMAETVEVLGATTAHPQQIV
jgi:hypothetical protein